MDPDAVQYQEKLALLYLFIVVSMFGAVIIGLVLCMVRCGLVDFPSCFRFR